MVQRQSIRKRAESKKAFIGCVKAAINTPCVVGLACCRTDIDVEIKYKQVIGCDDPSAALHKKTLTIIVVRERKLETQAAKNKIHVGKVSRPFWSRVDIQ